MQELEYLLEIKRMKKWQLRDFSVCFMAWNIIKYANNPKFLEAWRREMDNELTS
jgi:hypothetical protein